MLLRIHHMRLEFRNVKPGCRRTAPIVESLLESFQVQTTKAWRDRVGDCLAHGVRR